LGADSHGSAARGSRRLLRRACAGADPGELDLVGLGQNSVDHICLVERYPRVGTKVDALGHHLLPGGQVATAVLAARRQGRSAAYVGAVGDDELGEKACSVLHDDGVALSLKVVPGGTTQFAMIVVDRSGERTIVEHYDPEVVVRADELDRELITSARVLHLDITDVPAAIQAARWAGEAGTLVSLDIDRMLPGADELLGLVDLLVASEHLPQELGSPDPRLGLHTLRRHCPGRVVCITSGERGCVALDSEENAIWVPAFDVPVTDTTGCGDVFRGALIHGVLESWPLQEALRYASAAAALQAGTLGAQGGVPDGAQVRAFLETDPALRSRGG
jgi:sugar/nucleoside kinase (ribokinase family)